MSVSIVPSKQKVSFFMILKAKCVVKIHYQLPHAWRLHWPTRLIDHLVDFILALSSVFSLTTGRGEKRSQKLLLPLTERAFTLMCITPLVRFCALHPRKRLASLWRGAQGACWDVRAHIDYQGIGSLLNACLVKEKYNCMCHSSKIRPPLAPPQPSSSPKTDCNSTLRRGVEP